MPIEPIVRTQPEPAPDAGTEARPDLSVIVPVYNEAENVRVLHREIVDALEGIGHTWEVVFVDDGSADGTTGALRDICRLDARVRAVIFRRNFGQTAALAAGFDHARGGVIVPMDGDLQNDPRDIPRLIEKIDQGYDVVSGWRRRRRDRFLTRRLPSMLANWLIGRLTRVRIHDYGCTLKAYRREVIRNIKLYGEMHRFIPVYASWVGARVLELEVNHRPRLHGTSKYGLIRVVKVILDLITVKFLGSFGKSPIYAFGGPGLFMCAGGLAAGAWTLWEKFAHGIWVHRNPLILLAVFLFTLGAQCILIGLLAEIAIRTYYESQDKPTYFVREIVRREE
jgi:glycosyltransferase involved in cell wall biosynthesis